MIIVFAIQTYILKSFFFGKILDRSKLLINNYHIINHIYCKKEYLFTIKTKMQNITLLGICLLGWFSWFTVQKLQRVYFNQHNYFLSLDTVHRFSECSLKLTQIISLLKVTKGS